MKERYIKQHAEDCGENGNGSKFCDYNPERFLFYLKNDFYLITYPRCLRGYTPWVDFNLKIIKSFIGNNKVYKYYETNKSVRVDEDLKEFRLRNKTLREYVQEVNFLYGNCAKWNQFAITTKIRYLDYIVSQKERLVNYKKAEEYLKKNGFDFLLQDLEDLYLANSLGIYDEAEIYKTIDHLVNSINQIVKNGNN